jgi:hypothetical protein
MKTYTEAEVITLLKDQVAACAIKFKENSVRHPWSSQFDAINDTPLVLIPEAEKVLPSEKTAVTAPTAKVESKDGSIIVKVNIPA